MIIDSIIKLAKMFVKVGLVVLIAYYASFAVTVSSFSDEIPLTSNRYVLKSDCLRELNIQVNSELYASMMYMNMGAYFDNNKVARKGFSKFFSDQSREEKEHSHKLVDYINKRGGIVDVLNVKMPDKNAWDSPRHALEEALKLENDVNDYIHKIHSIAEHTCQDPHLMDFLEAEYLEEQVNSINQIKRLLTMLNNMDNGVGEYLLDRQLLEGHITPEYI